MDTQTRTAKQRPLIEFMIDGETYETSEHKLTAEDVLGYAGKSFESHYLVELLGRGNQRPYKSASESVNVHPGSKFVTVRTGATPVA